MKLYKSALLDEHLIFCLIHVKTGLSHIIISMKCMVYGSKYEAILKMLLLYLVE